MLKKELLLCGVSKKPTHTIVVGELTIDNTQYGYNSMFGTGSITPNTMDGVFINYLQTVYNLNLTAFQLGTWGSLQFPYSIVRITRLDTNVTVSFQKPSNVQYYQSNTQFFSANDVGKAIELIIEGVS